MGRDYEKLGVGAFCQEVTPKVYWNPAPMHLGLNKKLAGKKMKIYIARDEQAEIAGTFGDLREIQSSIVTLAAACENAITIPAHSTEDPSPWDECLARLTARPMEIQGSLLDD